MRVFASYLIRVQLNESVDPQYLWFFLQSEEYWTQIQSVSKGTAQPGANATVLSQLRVPVPPIAEQRRIVTRLSSLTKNTARARERLGRIPNLIQKYRKAILAAALAGPLNNAKRKDIGQLTELVTSGSRGWAKYYSDTGSAFIRVGNVRRDNIQLDVSDLQRVSPPRGAEGERTSLQQGDIVITITADLGRVGLVSSDLGNAYVNQHVALVRLKGPEQARWGPCRWICASGWFRRFARKA